MEVFLNGIDVTALRGSAAHLQMEALFESTAEYLHCFLANVSQMLSGLLEKLDCLLIIWQSNLHNLICIVVYKRHQGEG